MRFSATYEWASTGVPETLLRERPLFGALAITLVVALLALNARGAWADHPDAPDPVSTDDTGKYSSGNAHWDAKDEETCAYNQHHSSRPASQDMNGHQSVVLLNEGHREGDEYPLFTRLKNGGIRVSPVFNCLPNFWGWVVYRNVNGVPEFVDDLSTDIDGDMVGSPQGYAFSGGKFAPKPQHERPRHSNTVPWDESGFLMSGAGMTMTTEDSKTDPQKHPQLNPNGDHIVFRYESLWRNGDNAIQERVPFYDGKHSVTSDEPLTVKIWTAEMIEEIGSGSTSTNDLNPFGEGGNHTYLNLRTWPNADDPASRDGYAVDGHVSMSIWDRVIRAMHPDTWARAIAAPVGGVASSVACGIWERAANVQSDGCLNNREYRVAPYPGYWLENGSEGVPAMLKGNDGRVVRKGYRGVDPDREIYFVKRMGVGSDSVSGERGGSAIVARLSERGYPVQVAAPPSQSGNWPAGSPAIVEISVSNPPVAAPPSFVPGEAINIKVVFSEPVAFVPWNPVTSDVNVEHAAQNQTRERLRLRLAGLTGCAGNQFEIRECESARYDVSANAALGRPQRTWMFRYVVPRGVHTAQGDYLSVSGDNGVSGASGQAFAAGHESPFWFSHPEWLVGSNNANQDAHFLVGASFAGPNRQTDRSTGEIEDSFDRSAGNGSPGTHDIPDLRISRHAAPDNDRLFANYNTIKDVSPQVYQTILDHRKYSRDILSFNGLLKGTPASATYERGYVALGWTVMLNLVFALFVLFIIWAAITSIVRPMVTGQDAGYGWKEMSPRVILAAIAAGSSFWWCRLLIDLADAVSNYVAEALALSPGDIIHIVGAVRSVILSAPAQRVALDGLAGNAGILFSPSTSAWGILLVVFALIFFLVLGLLILGQFILRIVLLNLLMILAPVGMAMFVLPDTAGWGRRWLQLWMVTLFRHAIQVVGLGLALSFVRSVIPLDGEWIGMMDVTWALILGCFALYLTFKLPTLLGDGGISEGYLGTMFMITNVMSHLPGAVRTGVNLTAAGATGGAGGVALTALGASPAAISHFTSNSSLKSP